MRMICTVVLLVSSIVNHSSRQDLDRGIITREEANKIMLEKAAHANRVFEVQTCLDEWFTMLETNKTTVQIMRKLKAAGYRLYYLTNIPTDVMDELRQREWFSLFDGGIASCDVHLCKPEPEIPRLYAAWALALLSSTKIDSS